MPVKIRFLDETFEVNLPEGAKVEDALKAAGIDVESVIVRKDKQVLMDEDEVEDGDELEAIRVISGG